MSKRIESEIIEQIDFLINLHKEQIELSQEEYGGVFLTGLIFDEGEDGKVGQFELEGNAFDCIIFNVPVYKDEHPQYIESLIYEQFNINSFKLFNSHEQWEKACL